MSSKVPDLLPGALGRANLPRGLPLTGLLVAGAGIVEASLIGSVQPLTLAGWVVAALLMSWMLCPPDYRGRLRSPLAALLLLVSAAALPVLPIATSVAAAAAAAGLLIGRSPGNWLLPGRQVAGAIQLLLGLLSIVLLARTGLDGRAPLGLAAALAHAGLGAAWLFSPDPDPLERRVPRRCAALMIGIGVLAMAAWMVDDAVIVQAGTDRIPFPFNTALAMTLAGLSLRALVSGRRRTALLMLLPTIPMVLAALAEEYLGLQLGAGEWLVSHGVTAEGAGPGRMAPNAAIAFLLGALAVLLAPSRADGVPGRWAATWACGFIVAVSALIVLAGYLSGMPELRAWELKTPMSLWAGLGLACYGVGLGFAGAEQAAARRRRTAWVPLLVALGSVVASVLVWQALSADRARAMQAQLEQRAARVERAIESGYELRASALQRMAERLSELSDEDQRGSRFPLEAEVHLRDFPSLIGFALLDASRRVRQVVPERPDWGADIKRSFETDALRRELLTNAAATGALVRSPRLTLLNGTPGQLLVAPLRGADGQPSGFLVAAVDHRKLFPDLLASVAASSPLRLSHQGSTLLGPAALAKPALVETFEAGGLEMQLELGTPAGSQDGRRLATALLLTGLLGGGLLALALRMAALARERARSAESAIDALRDQIAQRRRAETALTSSQKLVADVLESVSDAVVMLDPDWKFVYLNPRAERLLRRSRRKLIGKQLWQQFPDSVAVLRQPFEQAMDEGRTLSLEEFYRPLQSWFEIRAYPHPRGLAVYFRDVTDRKQQLLQLEHSEMLVRAAGKMARVGGWEVDLGSRQVNFTDLSREIYGLPRGAQPSVDEAIGFCVPECREPIRAVFERCIEDGTPWDTEQELITAAGKRIWVRSLGAAQRDPQGNIVRIHGALQDITDAKLAELQLRQSSEEKSVALENLRQIMDSSIEVICSVDEQGRFVTLNAASERVWGYPPEELQGEPIARIIYPDDLDATARAVAELVGGKPNLDFRNRNVTRDGRVIHMQWSASWSGQTRRMYCIGRDRTAEHRAEQFDSGQRAILTSIAADAPLPDSLDAMVKLYEQQYPDAIATVMLMDGDRRHLWLGAGNSLPAGFADLIDGAAIGPAVAAFGTAAWRGECVISADIATDPLWTEFAVAAAECGLRASWSVPVLSSRDEILATFAVYYRESRQPTAAEQLAIEGMAAIAAIAIEQAATNAVIVRHSDRLRRLAEAGVAINRSIGQAGLCQLLVDLLRSTVGSRMAVLSLTEAGSWEHVTTAVSLDDCHARWRDYDAQPDGSGIYRLVFESAKPLRLTQAELEQHPAFRKFGGRADSHPPLRGLLAVPLIASDGGRLGVLQLSDKRDGEFDDDDASVAMQFAHMAATALERSQLIERLRERDRFFDMALELFCVYDPVQQRFLQVNPAFTELLGYSEAELLGQPSLEFVHPEDREAASRNNEHMREQHDEVLGFINRYVAADGSVHWLEWAGSADRSGLYHLVARNITERRRIELERDFAESHDAATGLPRYPILEIALADMLDRGLEPSLFFIDLDRLHAINESMGHMIGDEALKKTAERLERVIGDTERIARFAGDEFVAVLPGLDRSEALALAERLRQAVAEPIEGEGYRVFLTASIGISRAPQHGENATELLRRAEAAMTEAKQQGRDGICEFSAERMQQLDDRRVLGSRLRDAINNGELYLHYQPRVNAVDRRLNGFEALARWYSSELGQVPPDRFVPIAEALGLMPELGHWVLQQACRQIRGWLDLGHRDFTVSVNVSAQQLQRADLVDQVRSALAAEQIPPHMLDIELTESSLMENVERVQYKLAELKALGVSLSLDDFGTGYSSLAYLKQFSLDKLKIDRCFVSDLPGDLHDAAIARTIVAMAHQLKMKVAAEGVETEAQASFLRDIGCDELQGYWFGRPLAADAAVPLFAHD